MRTQETPGPGGLDAIDRKILRELQDDGRMTNVELARRAGISAPPCLRRVRRLEEAGIIRGYHADTDPATLAYIASPEIKVTLGIENIVTGQTVGFNTTPPGTMNHCADDYHP